MAFVRFMTTTKGRVVRIVAGIALFVLGQLLVKGTPGNIMSILALIPMSGGVLDFCLAGVIFGYPFKGAKAREQLAQEAE